jgi:aryl-alcohol dehydrogenase-like predicted oxidoreductase
MKTYTVPHTDLEVPGVVLGLMRIAKMEDAEIRALFDAAIESGITFFDHADVYGGRTSSKRDALCRSLDTVRR